MKKTTKNNKSCMAKVDYAILTEAHGEQEAVKIMLLAAALHKDSQMRIKGSKNT